MKKLIAFVSLTLSLSAMADTNYSCFGTEPFWDLKTNGKTLVFNAMMEDETTKTEEILSTTQAAGMVDGYAFVIETKTSSSAIVRGECSDGMSDEIYSHHIVYKDASKVLYGCCNEVK